MNEQGVVLLENLDYRKLHWCSDWDGEDIGFPSINVIGHYMYGELNLYIDTETEHVIELWFDEEEEF